MLAAGAAGIGALAVGLKVGISEYIQASKVAAQTNAVIKSTGGAANVTAKQVDELAQSLMRKSGVDDEVIKSGENMLLTFTNIRNEAGRGNDIFTQSTKVLLDMSTALGQDMSKSAIQLGKALNDPIKGISALRRVGVSFTDDQKKVIEHLVATGHAMDAQKLILRELNKEFGGSAAAIGKTLPGQLNILREEFNNFAGDLVAKAVPALLSFTGFLNNFSAAPTLHAKLNVVWEGLQDVGTALFAAIGEALHGHNERVRVDLNEWVTIHHEGVVEKLRTELMAEVHKINWSDVFVGMFQSIDWGALLSGAFHAIITISKTQWTIVAEVWLGAWRAILTGLQAGAVLIVQSVVDAMGRVVGSIRGAVGGALSAALALGTSIVTGVRSGVASLIAAVHDKIDAIPGAVRAFAGAAAAAGFSVGAAIVSGVGHGIMSLVGGIAAQAAGAIHSIVDAMKSAAHIKSPSELTETMVGRPLAEGIIVGFLGTKLREALVGHVMDAKQSIDNFVGSTGVANMAAQGAMMGASFRRSFATEMGVATAFGAVPNAIGLNLNPGGPGPVMEPRVRSQNPDGAITIPIDVNLDGKVIARVVTTHQLAESYTKTSIFGGRA